MVRVDMGVNLTAGQRHCRIITLRIYLKRQSFSNMSRFRRRWRQTCNPPEALHIDLPQLLPGQVDQVVDLQAAAGRVFARPWQRK